MGTRDGINPGAPRQEAQNARRLPIGPLTTVVEVDPDSGDIALVDLASVGPDAAGAMIIVAIAVAVDIDFIIAVLGRLLAGVVIVIRVELGDRCAGTFTDDGPAKKIGL